MAPDIDGVLNHADGSRRDFLRKLIASAAFAPPVFASFNLDGLSLTAAEATVGNQCVVSNATAFANQTTPSCFDFSGSQYGDNFTDVVFTGVARPDEISAGPDVGGTGHQALNITGQTGSGGNTWATLLNQPIPSSFLTLSADILIHRFDNSKGVGLLARAFNLSGGKALALVVNNAGNTDRLQLLTIDTTGKATLVPGQNVSLGAGIAENAWYRLEMHLSQGFCSIDFNGITCVVSVDGRVLSHTDPTDPDSDLGAQVGAALHFQGSFGAARIPERVGIVARAVSAFVDSSVTNFCVNCTGSGGPIKPG